MNTLFEKRHGSYFHRFQHFMGSWKGHIDNFHIRGNYVSGHQCIKCGYVTPNTYISNPHPCHVANLQQGWNYGTEKMLNMKDLFPAHAYYIQRSP